MDILVPPTKLRPCRFCDAFVDSSKTDVDYCRACYYSGVYFNEKFAGLLAEIDTTAFVHHTGGGCFVIEVPLAGGGWLWANESEDSALPDTEDGPWWLVRYTDAAGDEEGTVIGTSLTRLELLVYVETELDNARRSAGVTATTTEQLQAKALDNVRLAYPNTGADTPHAWIIYATALEELLDSHGIARH